MGIIRIIIRNILFMLIRRSEKKDTTGEILNVIIWMLIIMIGALWLAFFIAHTVH